MQRFTFFKNIWTLIKNHWIKLFLTTIFVSFPLICFFLFCELSIKQSVKKEILIKKGSSFSHIMHLLKKEDLINNALLFKAYARLFGLDKKIKFGYYRIPMGTSDFCIMWRVLAKGPYPKIIKITVPEGFTLKQIARILEEKLDIPQKYFLTKTQEPEFIQEVKERCCALIESPPSLEGYLYPDTYFFFYGTDVFDVVCRMVKKMCSLFSEKDLERMKKKGLSFHEVLTLASIVEKEALVDSEKPIIAAVFENRLKKRKPLESCATVEYILPKHKPLLTEEDLSIDSPYNTYIYTGLPPGPIGAPSWSSIHAVLYPAKVKYLYFVARGDGTHLFATTYIQHLKNKKRVRKLWHKYGFLK